MIDKGYAILRDSEGPTVVVPCDAPEKRVPRLMKNDGKERRVWKWTRDEASALRLAARFAGIETERESDKVAMRKRNMERAAKLLVKAVK